MGPIGIIMMPTFEIRKYSELPFSSTLNGSCSNVCPVKINIHEQIYAWRGVMDEKHQVKLAKKGAMIVAGEVLSHPEIYRIATSATEEALKVLPRFAIYNDLNAWGKHRETPAPAKQTFHKWYAENRK
jgi:L-lactate dehydrogenase complex protein LldF